MPDDPINASPGRLQVMVAFAAVYLIWGSTYLAIRFAIETIPPLLMAGVRFLVAGLLLYAWIHRRDVPRPTRAHWITATVVGAFLLLGGNGGVVWAEQYVPSGLTALLVATVPLWIAVLDWARPGGAWPTGSVMLGVGMGVAGLALLIGPDDLLGGGRVHLTGALVLIGAALSWAIGSLYARHSPLPASPFSATSIEMLMGGVLLILAGLIRGEAAHLDVSAISLQSGIAFGYLILFGSLGGFTAYIWLLKNVPPVQATTYAYVNPVVAVFLGWALADEPLTGRVLLAAAIIVAAVVMITMKRPTRRVKVSDSSLTRSDTATAGQRSKRRAA